LNIQARSQEEIAVSILAEIIQVSKTVPAQQSGLTILAAKLDAARDPICGMSVDIAKAQHKSEFEGRRFYFCCAGCKRAFDAQPQKYALAGTSQ
jgi:xanthine dehydrogenase accessory factor